jgi:hexosaminidase
MRAFSLTAVFLLCFFSSAHAVSAPAKGFRNRPAGLWPRPQSHSSLPGGDLTAARDAFDFSLSGIRAGFPQAELLQRAFVRYNDILFGTQGVSSDKKKTQKDEKRDTLEKGEADSELLGLRVHVRGETASDYIQLGTDESYSLWVNSSQKGFAFLEANTVFGALRGLETFSQLFYGPGLGDAALGDVLCQQTRISDAPRFPWRGLLIDTSRHYLPVTTLKRLIDGLPFNKLNTLHWHVVDGQSFPLVSTSPVSNRLSMGAYAPHMVYRPEDVEDLVAYANDRGVRLVRDAHSPGFL